VLPSDLVVLDDPPREDLDFLEGRIDAFNEAATGYRDGRRLAILLRDAAGTICAGLSGHTWGGACEVKFLWVEESRRHAGLGSRLLQAAEQEARARGCAKIFVSTHSFQAPGFYRRLGYALVGEAAGYPRGHAHLHFEKSLG
jgi:GNAT superfamily N-acetyltransferase